jgi:hypothetical protein
MDHADWRKLQMRIILLLRQRFHDIDSPTSVLVK